MSDEIPGFSKVGVDREHCSDEPCEIGCFHCENCGMPDCGYHLIDCPYAEQGLTE